MPGKNSSVQTCTKNPATIWVSVKQLNSAASVPGATVTLTGPGKNGPSSTLPADGAGLAKFASLKPGKYAYSVTLPGEQQMRYKLEPYSGALAVGRGDTAVGGAEAAPIGTLTVRVIDDGIPPQAVQGVVLSVAGAESAQRPTGAGTHSFIGVRAGNYTVTATADHLTRYAPRGATSVVVAVPAGGTGAALVILQTANTATPVIDLVPAMLPRLQNEVWFVKQAHQTQATAAGFVEAPLELRFRYTETNVAKPFVGGGTVSFDPAVKLFRDAAMTLPVVAPGHTLQLSHAELAGVISLYAKGAAVGTAQVRLSLDQPIANSGILITGSVAQAVDAKEVVMVEPQVQLEYKVVVFDRDLAQHQTAAAEPAADLLRPKPTRIEVSLKRSAGAPPPYIGLGTLAAPNCTVFTDEACTLPLGARQLTNLELTGTDRFKLWLRGTTRGLFNLTLTLDPANDPRLFVALPTPEPMGVVEIQAQIHHHATPVNVAATTYPLTNYCPDLENVNLIPDQIVMTDADKVREGRLLHLQAKKAHGRAKVIVKLTAAEWPAGTDDYEVVLASDHDGLTGYDRDADGTNVGTKVALPLKVKVSALKLADRTVWIEGSAISSTIRSKRLSVGLDRPAGGLWRAPITHADWGRFTVVKIESVKLEYTAPAAGQPKPWNASKHRWYINYQAGDAGRTVKIRVKLSKPIAGIRIHFMLAPDEDNLKEKNWGIDLPAGPHVWTWDAIDADVKQKDKDLPTNLLHKFEPTDADGKADKDLVLSRFGGDAFCPAAYIPQDPHLAAYVHGHATLDKRKPALCDHRIKVWRKFAYQKVKVAGTSYPSTTTAEDVYGRIRAKMLKRPSLTHSASAVKAMALPSLFPRYMFKVNGGKKTVLNVSDANTAQFFAGMGAETENPIKIPIVTCDFNWGDERDSAAVAAMVDVPAANFPLAIDTDALVCKPPLQGNALVVSGDWNAADWDAGTASWINPRNGTFTDADVSIDPNRPNLNQIKLALPAGVGAVNANTSIDIDNLVVQGADDEFLGGYNIDNVNQRIVCVYDPTNPADYQNTVVHEVGHAFHQTPQAPPAPGIPVHPHWVNANNQGTHCHYNVNVCVMYDDGTGGSLNRFCPVCHAFMLVQDMEQLS